MIDKRGLSVRFYSIYYPKVLINPCSVFLFTGLPLGDLYELLINKRYSAYNQKY